MSRALSIDLAPHLAKCVRAVRRRYRQRLSQCQEEFSEPAVHRLRIETRRLLTLLDLLHALNAGGNVDKLRRALKKRLDAFSQLRDTQVQLRLLKPVWRKDPGAELFERILHRSETRIVARLARKIKTAKAARLNRRLKQLEKRLRPKEKAAPSAADCRQARSALRTAFAQVVLCRGRVRPRRTNTIHRLRLAFKQFRYMSELLHPAVSQLTPQQLKRMKAYQDRAGIIQDLEVLLNRLALAVKARELKPAVAGRMRARLLAQRRRAIAVFQARLDDLFEFQPPGFDRSTRTKEAFSG